MLTLVFELIGELPGVFSGHAQGVVERSCFTAPDADVFAGVNEDLEGGTTEEVTVPEKKQEHFF